MNASAAASAGTPLTYTKQKRDQKTATLLFKKALRSFYISKVQFILPSKRYLNFHLQTICFCFGKIAS
ncbi:hypothetical protein BVL54_16180 [Bacillus paralicheniformis]|nr:hypothetical protein BVL54_16180 [Bacillus paralicheniformis]